jgi:outer membrane protein assembly factor BamB
MTMKRRTAERNGLWAWLWMPGLWVVWALHLATAAEPIGERWRFETGLAGSITPALAPDSTIYYGAGDFRSDGADGMIYTQGVGSALAADGELRWTYPVDGAISSTSAVGADGTLYFGAANVARFHAVSASGARLWLVDVSSGASQASPVIGLDGTVYCGGIDGRLFALSSAGQLKWSVPLGGEISGTPALAADGSLYVGTTGRKVFRVSDQGQVLGESMGSHLKN